MERQSLIGLGRVALAALVLVGCETTAAPVDAGPMRDAFAQCASDDECDDARFCTGVERCDPANPAGDSRGCVASPEGTPCAEGQACDEETDTCTTLCEVTEDADGDGSRAVECGGDDCDDANPGRFPANPEICDLGGVDEDCDPTTFGDRDIDGDGVIDAACCNGESCGLDCDDLRRGTAPGNSEVCNGFDDDCDGMIDEGVLVMAWPDTDFDLHGDSSAEPQMRCAGSFGFAIVSDDCDDSDPAIHSAQVEICDGLDNDCDGTADEAPAAVTWYLDGDGDGFGSSDPATTRVSCTPLVGYSLRSTDCDDTRAGVSPSTPERCDGLDNDCNGRPDFFVGPRDTEDDDLDGHADLACPSGDDCDDRDPYSYPGALELCDGRDNDCNDAIDDGTAMGQWWIDRDGDTFGDAADSPTMSCTPVRGHALRGGDCDDSSEARRPGATELCDGVDDDCDASIDESSAREPFYLDADGDGLGAGLPVLACERPIDRVPNASDCDDTERTVGAATLYFVDADDDGWGDPRRSELACSAPPGRITRGGDCDDTSPTSYPMSTELCGGADEDCDGVVDEDPEASAGCSITGASAVCASGVCSISSCDVGYADCNSMPGDGCETHLVDDPANCGMCGRSCASGSRCRQDECVRVLELAAGRNHVCARLDTGEVLCWGANNAGQLGRGSTVTPLPPAFDDSALVLLYTGAILDDAVAIASSVAADFTCALRASGEVVCWGNNGRSQLGEDAIEASSSRAVRIPGISAAVELAVGDQHACARLGSGAVRCWGDNRNGQLGLGSVTPDRSGIPLAMMQSGSGGSTEITDAIGISAGLGFSCVLHAGATRVTCVGAGYDGQLGRGSIASDTLADDVLLPAGLVVSELRSGAGYSCVRAVGGPPWCWGSNAYGVVSAIPGNALAPRVVDALLFETTNAMWLGDNALFVAYQNASLGPRVGARGRSGDSQLGIGSEVAGGRAVDMHTADGGRLSEWPVQIAPTTFAGCALMSSGTVTCWGTTREVTQAAATRTEVDLDAAIPYVP